MSEHTKGYCWAHHKELSLQADCPGGAAEVGGTEGLEYTAAECGLCSEICYPHPEGGYDCDNCGNHWEF